MKKTLITLLALAGLAAASEPTEYPVTFADNGTTKLTTQRSHLVFNGDNSELSSWMLEFSIDKLGIGGNTTFFATDLKGWSYEKEENGVTSTVTEERAGLGLYTWYDKTGITIGLNNAHRAGSDSVAPDKIDLNFVNGISSPITLRFAYDSVSNKAYLYRLDTGSISTMTLATDYSLKGSNQGNANDVNGKAMFWTDAGASNFSVTSVSDLSAIAGNDELVHSYITASAVPEPTTATLSLLALAGLAARRRRK